MGVAWTGLSADEKHLGAEKANGVAEYDSAHERGEIPRPKEDDVRDRQDASDRIGTNANFVPPDVIPNERL